MFLLLGYGEKAGSGSTRIMNAWEGAHWRKPLINVLPRPDRVVPEYGAVIASKKYK